MTQNDQGSRQRSPNWNPSQYSKFSEQRLRPALELLDRIPLEKPSLVYDLGCGTGHVTRLISERWESAAVVGIDNSVEMLDKAEAESAKIQWIQADINNWTPQDSPDLIYSNAALHWLDSHDDLFPRLARFLAPGGCLAVQMPLSWDMPSHLLMRESLANGGPQGKPLGTGALRLSVGRKWVEDAEVYYNLLGKLSSSLDIWESEYLQILTGEEAVFEWVQGTGLRPILQGLPEDQLPVFLDEYRRRLEQVYPQQSDGHTLYPFRRLFIVTQVF